MLSPADWIQRLDLQAHPEGGFYRETHRSGMCFPGDGGSAVFPAGRSHSTAIYFLLEQGNFSAFHRIRSDEIWHFYVGDGLLIHVIDADGEYSCLQLGANLPEGQLPQAVVPAGCWFASEVVPGGVFSLVGCTVAPGFHFDDFELADGIELSACHTQHASLIRRLTRHRPEKNSGTG